jgi:hypothetical protein
MFYISSYTAKARMMPRNFSRKRKIDRRANYHRKEAQFTMHYYTHHKAENHGLHHEDLRELTQPDRTNLVLVGKYANFISW